MTAIVILAGLTLGLGMIVVALKHDAYRPRTVRHTQLKER